MHFESASVKDGAIKAFLSLFPAHAGVILRDRHIKHAYMTFPRARGGDPNNTVAVPPAKNFSPRTRG